MKSGMKLVLVAAAVGVAGLANACSRDGGVPRSVAGPRVAPDVVEGAHVRGQLTRTLQLMGPGGEVRAETTSTESFDAPVRRGIAVSAQGRTLATVGRAGRPTGPLTFTDSSGHRHEIVLERGADGEPPKAVRASLDGRLLARVEFSWQHTGHGFVMTHRRASFFRPNGSEGLREDIATDVRELASRTPANRALQAAGGLAAAAVLPARLEAEEACWSQWIYYGFASLGVGVAVMEVYQQPWNLKMWVALGVAVALWDKAFDNLSDCMVLL